MVMTTTTTQHLHTGPSTRLDRLIALVLGLLALGMALSSVLGPLVLGS
jgi:hypothetical protein